MRTGAVLAIHVGGSLRDEEIQGLVPFHPFDSEAYGAAGNCQYPRYCMARNEGNVVALPLASAHINKGQGGRVLDGFHELALIPMVLQEDESLSCGIRVRNHPGKEPHIVRLHFAGDPKGVTAMKGFFGLPKCDL